MNNLPAYDSKEIIAANTRLAQYVHKKDIYLKKHPVYAIDLEISENFSRKNMRRSFYINCHFFQSDFRSTGFAGSLFESTDFKDCLWDNANFHSCDFKNVCLKNHSKQIRSAGFHKSSFANCTIENIKFFSCGFTDVLFTQTTFRNCTIELSSMENARFDNCIFENVNFGNLNLEYVEFYQTTFKSTILPFVPIPFSFGLFECINSAPQEISIASTYNESGTIAMLDYYNLLPDLIVHYTQNEGFFPLSNIYIALGNYDLAYESITFGLLKSIKIKDFRSCKYYVKQAYTSGIFTTEQRRELYRRITSWINHEKLTIAEYHSFQLHVGQIQRYLLSSNCNSPTVYINLHSNILEGEEQKLAILISEINLILQECSLSAESIELRHNSPYDDLITCVCTNIGQVSKVLMSVYVSLMGIRVFSTLIKNAVETYQDWTLKRDQHKLNQQQIKAFILEQESKQLEVEKQKLELKKLSLEIDSIEKKGREHSDVLKQHGIIICSMEHSTANIQLAPFKEILFYSTK